MAPAAGADSMKNQLYDGSRKILVDTRSDECLYAAPRPSHRSPGFQHQGKDLYLWTTSKTISNKILPVSPATAERFLRGKGLICNLFPKSDPIATLYRWGYGIAEEF
jgi:hypothetical protein